MNKGYNQILEKWLKSGLNGLSVENLTVSEALFYFSYKKLGKTFLITPSLNPYASVHQSGHEEKFAEELDAFLTSRYPRAYIDLHIKGELTLAPIFKRFGYLVEEKFNYALDLKQDLELLRNGLSSTRRRHINKAAKEIEILTNARIQESFELFRSTYEEKNLSISPDYFEILESEVFKDELILSSAIYDNRVVAANLCLHEGDVALYLLGGINKVLAPSFAGTASLWNCIVRAKERGAAVIDFCGSGVPSIARYFSSFGAKPIPFIRIKKGHEKVDLMKKIKSRLLN